MCKPLCRSERAEGKVEVVAVAARLCDKGIDDGESPLAEHVLVGAEGAVVDRAVAPAVELVEVPVPLPPDKGDKVELDRLLGGNDGRLAGRADALVGVVNEPGVLDRVHPARRVLPLELGEQCGKRRVWRDAGFIVGDGVQNGHLSVLAKPLKEKRETDRAAGVANRLLQPDDVRLIEARTLCPPAILLCLGPLKRGRVGKDEDEGERGPGHKGEQVRVREAVDVVKGEVLVEAKLVDEVREDLWIVFNGAPSNLSIRHVVK